jgi:hypothetical protein
VPSLVVINVVLQAVCENSGLGLLDRSNEHHTYQSVHRLLQSCIAARAQVKILLAIECILKHSTCPFTSR